MNYQEFFTLAKEKKITNIQVTEKNNISSSLELINGELISYDDCNNTSYSIKSELDGKTVKIQTEYLSEEVLDNLILAAKHTDSNYEDEYLRNIENITIKNLPEFNISNELKNLREYSDLRKKYPQVKKLTIIFSEENNKTRIINSNSVDISTSSHLCKLYVEALAEKDGIFTSFNQELLETNKNKINFYQFIENVLEKTIMSIEKEKIKTAKYNLIIDSAVVGCIIAKLATMASSCNIREKTSCFEKKLNKKLFSDKLTIIEDPCNQKYPGYCLFDEEGIRTCEKTIIKNGVYKLELSNTKEAKLKNEPSTGNAYEGIGTRNMYIVPGNKNIVNLLKELNNGIYITDYMGAIGTSINTVTGNISLQIFGFMVKNGKIVSGIEPCIMTTTIFELLSNIREIGNDLQFILTSAGAPSLLIDNISIAR